MIHTRRRGWLPALACVLVAAPSAAVAQAGRSQAQQGNRLYDEGRFREAHEKYLEGLAAAPESGVLRFNDGNALYRSEDWQSAMEAYQRAIETGDAALASSAWYNLGNALYRSGQLEPSLEAYKQALRLDASNADAKHNLERVLEQMQQQQQQQQNQDQQNQDPQSQPQPNDPGQQDRQQEDQRDQRDQRDQQQGQQPQDEPQQGRQGTPPPAPGQMTREEAERLLESVRENPDSLSRPAVKLTGPRPRHPW